MHGVLGGLFVAGFGAMAAFMIVVGMIFLRYQRDKHHYALLQTAMEKGLSRLPGGLPTWLVSLRQGVLVSVLGAGLLITGMLLNATAENISLPPEVGVSATQQLPENPPPEQMRGDPQRGGQGDLPPPPPPPPRESPVMERWHRIQTQHFSGRLAMSIGGILLLLGLTRVVFSRMERRYMDGGGN